MRVVQTANSNDVFVAWFECEGTELEMQASVFVVLSASGPPHAVLNNKPENYEAGENNFHDANLSCSEIAPLTRISSCKQTFLPGLVPQSSVFFVK